MYRVTKLLVLLVGSAFVSCTDFSIAARVPMTLSSHQRSHSKIVDFCSGSGISSARSAAVFSRALPRLASPA
jgi:hypothetical protein